MKKVHSTENYERYMDNRDVISLFSGAMGLDIGLGKAGLNVVIGQDFEPSCVETMRANGGRSALRFIGKTAERRSRAKRGRTSKKRSPVHFHSRIIALSIAMSLSVRPQSFKYASTFSRVFAPGYLFITS